MSKEKKVEEDIFADAEPVAKNQEHKTATIAGGDMKKLEEQAVLATTAHLFVGMPVHFFQKPDEPFAATIVKRHNGFVMDLVVHRPDNIVQWPKEVPKRGEKFVAGCWDIIS
jgi:hypothetical protein